MQELGTLPVGVVAEVELHASSAAAEAGRRSRRWAAARSRARGTIGVSSGTEPRSWPTSSSEAMSRRGTGEPPARAASAASITSPSPGPGRARSAASPSASRTASTVAAGLTSWPRSRSSRAALTRKRVGAASGRGGQMPVPAGGVDAGAVAGPAGEQRRRPRHPGGGHLQLGQAPQPGVVGGGRRERLGHAAPVRARRRRRRPPGRRRRPGSPGSPCAWPPRAARCARRPATARVRRTGVRLHDAVTEERRVALAQRRHGLGHHGEDLGAVVAVLDDVLPPPLGIVVAGGLGQRADRVVADQARCRRSSGPGRGRRAGRRTAPAGRRPAPSAAPPTPARSRPAGRTPTGAARRPRRRGRPPAGPCRARRPAPPRRRAPGRPRSGRRRARARPAPRPPPAPTPARGAAPRARTPHPPRSHRSGQLPAGAVEVVPAGRVP